MAENGLFSGISFANNKKTKQSMAFFSSRNVLRYHGRWIFKKNAKNLFFAVQIEETEKNNLQKEWRKKLFYFLR